MKARNLTTVAKKAALVLLAVISMAGAINAQDSRVGKHKITEGDILNLKAGIKSEIEGIKRDCIYYAAIYNIEEAKETLTMQLKKEENPGTRVLISLALCKLSDDNDLKSFNNEVLVDWNQKVNAISTAIFNENMSTEKEFAANVKKQL